MMCLALCADAVCDSRRGHPTRFSLGPARNAGERAEEAQSRNQLISNNLDDWHELDL